MKKQHKDSGLYFKYLFNSIFFMKEGITNINTATDVSMKCIFLFVFF